MLCLVIGLIVLSTTFFSLAYYYFTFDLKTTAIAESICKPPYDGTRSISLPNTTFIKSYRLLVFTKINGAWPTKDGGYIVSGTTDPNIMFIPPDGFVAKLNKQGNTQWVKLLKTTNSAGAGNPRGDEDVQSIIELSGGGYLMASKVWGFILGKEWQADNIELNKILFTRLDKNGNTLWSKSFTAFVEDAKNSVVETADKGFLFYAPIVDLAPDQRGEDSDVYQNIPFASLKVAKFNQSGDLQWSKNVKNFISRDNDSYLIQTPDGGFALAGNLTEPNIEKAPPYNYDTYPGLAKFDKNFNFQWAKSLEGTPMELATVIPKADGGFEMGWKKFRQAACVVHGLTKTEDNGYLVLGSGPSALSLVPNIQEIATGKQSGLVGFKFDSAGKMEWVKKMSFSFNDFAMPFIDFSLSSTVDDKLMLVAPFTWADADYKTKADAVNEKTKWYKEKYGEMEMLKELKDRTKQSQADWKTVQAVIQIASDSTRPGIFMTKMDQSLNISWAKTIYPHRSTTNYVTKSTTDSGAIIAGEYETEVVQSTMFGNNIYYRDGFLIKFDSSGNIKDNKNWAINYNGKITSEMMTPYAVSNDLLANVENYPLKLTNRKPEFSMYKKAKTTSYAPFASAKETFCPILPDVSAFDKPIQNSNNSSAETRTWPQINYERAIPAELINDKSKTINAELLPILNQLYNNQVKLTDNMGGAMLSYIFDRVITKEDVVAVKNYLVGLNYKTQDEGNNQLTMYKPGYFLILTFSVNHKDKAFLDVTY